MTNERLYHSTYEGQDMICDMSRLGDASGTASAKFHTADRSAVEGEHYEGAEGTVTFEPGEITKEVHIKCLRNPACTGTTQFHLKMSDVQVTAFSHASQLSHISHLSRLSHVSSLTSLISLISLVSLTLLTLLTLLTSHLSSLSGHTQGAMMGKYLHTASCKIVDMDTFPNSKYKEQLKQGDTEVIRKEINHYSLIWQYFK